VTRPVDVVLVVVDTCLNVGARAGDCSDDEEQVRPFPRFGGDYSPKSRSPLLAPSRKVKRSKSVRSWLRSVRDIRGVPGQRSGFATRQHVEAIEVEHDGMATPSSEPRSSGGISRLIGTP